MSQGNLLELKLRCSRPGQVIWIFPHFSANGSHLGSQELTSLGPKPTMNQLERSQKQKSSNKTNNKLAFSKPSTLFPRIHWLSHVTETLHGEEACGTMGLGCDQTYGKLPCQNWENHVSTNRKMRKKTARMIQHLCESVTHFLRVEVWVGQTKIEAIL